ncbi:MAG: hypothetical protein JXA21_06455 [Anaerolineae bacterium]|nr:hypothetical protein [Anaerolineae bacterium]
MMKNPAPEMLEFGERLAEQLPPWQLDHEYEYGYDSVRLVNPNLPEAAIHLKFDRERVAIFGVYLYHFGPSYGMEPRMTVSTKREMKAIAVEIRRRFLERYLELFAESVAAAHRAGMAQLKAQEFAEELATVFGEEAHNSGECWSVWSKFASFRVQPGSDHPLVTVEHFYGVNAALALELARLLVKWKEEHGDESD